MLKLSVGGQPTLGYHQHFFTTKLQATQRNLPVYRGLHQHIFKTKLQGEKRQYLTWFMTIYV